MVNICFSGNESESIKFIFMSHILYVNDTAFQAVIKMRFCYNYYATTWRNNCIGGSGSSLDFDKVWILLHLGFIRIWILLQCKFRRNFDFTTVSISICILSQFVLIECLNLS